MTAEHDKKRTAHHVDRLMARLKAAERERDEMRKAISEANTLTEYQMEVIQQRNTMLASSFAERDAKASQILRRHIELDAFDVARVTAEKERDKLRAEVKALRADAELQNVYVRELCRGLDAALDFAGTVGGGSSWWVDVWAEHDAAIDAARGAA